jgi:multidrug efflux pump
MSGIIDYAIGHARLTLALLVFLLLAGLTAYRTIPKEAEPDVKVPIIYVQLSQRGISPEDAERLLLKPVETQLKSVGDVKEMRATAFEGGGYVLLEFEAGFDSKSALADVRAKVDQAKHDLPKDVDEPQVLEVNLSLYPVLVVALAGDLPERSMLHIARIAKSAIEQVPGVLSAELRGARDEAVEIITEPMLMKSYGISLDQLAAATGQFNSVIAAGALEGQTGRFAVKVPSLIETPQDVLKVPVIASAGVAVTLGDVAQVRPTFKDATSVTRVNGRPAMTIEISKRTGANLIETVDAVKATNDPAFGATGERLAEATDSLAHATEWILAQRAASPDAALAGATTYLRLFASAAGGCMLADEALAAARRRDDGAADGVDSRGRVAIARFFAENLAGQAPALARIVTEAAGSVLAADAAMGMS